MRPSMRLWLTQAIALDEMGDSPVEVVRARTETDAFNFAFERMEHDPNLRGDFMLTVSALEDVAAGVLPQTDTETTEAVTVGRDLRPRPRGLNRWSRP